MQTRHTPSRTTSTSSLYDILCASSSHVAQLEPDIVVSTTTVTDATECPRRAILAYVESPPTVSLSVHLCSTKMTQDTESHNAAMLYGSMVHSLFQKVENHNNNVIVTCMQGLQILDFSHASLAGVVADVIHDNLLELYYHGTSLRIADCP